MSSSTPSATTLGTGELITGSISFKVSLGHKAVYMKNVVVEKSNLIGGINKPPRSDLPTLFPCLVQPMELDLRCEPPGERASR